MHHWYHYKAPSGLSKTSLKRVFVCNIFQPEPVSVNVWEQKSTWSNLLSVPSLHACSITATLCLTHRSVMTHEYPVWGLRTSMGRLLVQGSTISAFTNCKNTSRSSDQCDSPTPADLWINVWTQLPRGFFSFVCFPQIELCKMDWLLGPMCDTDTSSWCPLMW